MEIAMTKISPNGQIVIPLEIRKLAKITPSSKFMVITEGDYILLTKVDEKAFKEEMRLMKILAKSSQDIKEGKYTVLDTSLSDEEIDRLLRGKTKKKTNNFESLTKETESQFKKNKVNKKDINKSLKWARK